MQSYIVDVKERYGLAISDDGFRMCQDILRTNRRRLDSPSELFEIAIDLSIKDVGSPTLPEDLKRLTKLPGRTMLQVVRCANISAPVCNQSSKAWPRLLGFTLSDGVKRCEAIEFRPIPDLREPIPPGTKLMLEDCAVADGILLLSPQSFRGQCGQVERLLETWRMQQNAHKRDAAGQDSPPKFKPILRTPGEQKLGNSGKRVTRRPDSSSSSRTPKEEAVDGKCQAKMPSAGLKKGRSNDRAPRSLPPKPPQPPPPKDSKSVDTKDGTARVLRRKVPRPNPIQTAEPRPKTNMRSDHARGLGCSQPPASDLKENKSSQSRVGHAPQQDPKPAKREHPRPKQTRNPSASAAAPKSTHTSDAASGSQNRSRGTERKRRDGRILNFIVKHINENENAKNKPGPSSRSKADEDEKKRNGLSVNALSSQKTGGRRRKGDNADKASRRNIKKDENPTNSQLVARRGKVKEHMHDRSEQSRVGKKSKSRKSQDRKRAGENQLHRTRKAVGEDTTESVSTQKSTPKSGLSEKGNQQKCDPAHPKKDGASRVSSAKPTASAGSRRQKIWVKKKEKS